MLIAILGLLPGIILFLFSLRMMQSVIELKDDTAELNETMKDVASSLNSISVSMRKRQPQARRRKR